MAACGGEEPNPVRVGTDRITVINLTEHRVARRRRLAERPLPRSVARAGAGAAPRDSARRVRGGIRSTVRPEEADSVRRRSGRHGSGRQAGQAGVGQRPPEVVGMAKLKSELEVACPCCGALLVVDVNLGRVISHKEPEREDMPDLDATQRISRRGRRGARRSSCSRSRPRRPAATRCRSASRRPCGRRVTSRSARRPKREFDLD